MQVPKLDKIVLNMGIGEAVADSKKATAALKDLTAIAGQKPVATKARNSIAGFKLREGMVIGGKVTLRGDQMYEFLDRLITIALPRVKRLPRREGHGLRRSRQLRHRSEGAHRVPRDQLTTRSIRCGAWTSSICDHRAKTDEEAKAHPHRAFKLPVREAERGKGIRTMAKTSMIVNRQTKREKPWCEQYAARRAALKEQIRQRRERLPLEERFEARHEAGEAAAELLADPPSQPLRDLGPSARPTTASSRCRRIALRDYSATLWARSPA